MSLSDILGLGKILPIDKLIDIIGKMTGRLTKQYFDKKDIDTKAYEIKALAQARAEEMKIIASAVKDNFTGTGGIEYKEEKLQISSPSQPTPVNISQLPSPDLESRTQERLLFQQAKKQHNIESITSIAAEQLKDEPAIDNKPIDEDWMNRFFNIAEDISNEEMQSLWGKILAGEIKRPQSYSLRTLELIRNLSKEEADIITKIANFVIKIRNDYLLYKGNDSALEKYGISYYDVALLTEIGIIQPGDFITYHFKPNTSLTRTPILYGNLVLVVERQANASEQRLPVELFTKTGVEVLKLLNISPSLDYLKEIASFLKRADTTTKYGNILSFEGDAIRHTNLMEI
ncbi:DUF2806 domain-containing protein [Parafilimonas sp.]|uniref:DUF2806 domain-containing protein n=1 Tax=Parafilimonas sp. TaxID=1969739 RepID=UPI003F80C333